MKTLSITEGRQKLGSWLKRALDGEDVGFVVEGRVVALRPVQVISEDYVLQEYAITEKQAERAYRKVKSEVAKARTSGKSKAFTGTL
jgi:antitoxin (DNA-binding transcriptional repressor) of toxin-antitoxin stability system